MCCLRTPLDSDLSPRQALSLFRGAMAISGYANPAWVVCWSQGLGGLAATSEQYQEGESGQWNSNEQDLILGL